MSVGQASHPQLLKDHRAPKYRAELLPLLSIQLVVPLGDKHCAQLLNSLLQGLEALGVSENFTKLIVVPLELTADILGFRVSHVQAFGLF